MADRVKIGSGAYRAISYDLFLYRSEACSWVEVRVDHPELGRAYPSQTHFRKGVDYLLDGVPGPMAPYPRPVTRGLVR